MTSDKSLNNTDGQLDSSLDDTFPASDPVSQTDPTHGVRSTDVGADEEAVRQRAYAIWRQAGSPDGMHDQHWAQARKELDTEDAG
jgi:hypothetical protein